MTYITHVSVEPCSVWQVFGSRPGLEHIYKGATATTKNNNLCVQLFYQEEVIRPPLF